MINLDEISPSALTEMIDNAPEYEKRQFKQFVTNTIGAIHQIPHIFAKSNSEKPFDLKNVEAYFGRSSASADEPGKNIASRFKSHRDHVERRHQFGMIIAKTTIENTLLMERFGISVIEKLKEVGGLCIANKTAYSKGGVGDTEPGLLYMTFKFIVQEEQFGRVLSNSQIKSAVAMVMSELELLKSESKSVESAAELAFQAANEPRFIGGHQVNLYDPDKDKFLAPDLSSPRFKQAHF